MIPYRTHSSRGLNVCRLTRDIRGVAALELAIVAPVLLTITGGLADFGLAFSAKTQLAQAVASGGAYAFAVQETVGSTGSVSAVNVCAAVLASTTLAGGGGCSTVNSTAVSGSASNVAVTVVGPEPGCTQTNTSGSPPTSTVSLASSSYGTLCPSGSPVGTYVIITAQYTYQPVMPFYSGLASQVLTASATVRLY